MPFAPAAPPPDAEIAALLDAWGRGDRESSGRLVALVYRDLKQIARRELARERRTPTLQTTALVHEAYLRLAGQLRADFRNREHVLAVATTLMRRVLVDHARARLAEKRSHERAAIEDLDSLAGPAADVDLLDLDRALERLAADYPRPARVVELRVFGGLEIREIAAALDLSERTAKRDWAFGRAFLVRELDPPRPPA